MKITIRTDRKSSKRIFNVSGAPGMLVRSPPFYTRWTLKSFSKLISETESLLNWRHSKPMIYVIMIMMMPFLLEARIAMRAQVRQRKPKPTPFVTYVSM